MNGGFSPLEGFMNEADYKGLVIMALKYRGKSHTSLQRR